MYCSRVHGHWLRLPDQYLWTYNATTTIKKLHLITVKKWFRWTYGRNWHTVRFRAPQPTPWMWIHWLRCTAQMKVDEISNRFRLSFNVRVCWSFRNFYVEFGIMKQRPAAVASIYELLLLLFNEKWCRNKQQYIYFDLNRMVLENISQKHNSRHAFNAQFTAIGHAHISKNDKPIWPQHGWTRAIFANKYA